MYLLDTNICIHFMKDEYGIPTKIAQIGSENCFTSEVVILELLYGIANSATTRKTENILKLQAFEFQLGNRVLLIGETFQTFTEQKADLRKNGLLISDFDLLIGCTALIHNFTLVTRNVREMSRIEGLSIENWVD